MISEAVPEGFSPVSEGFGFADALQPLYIKQEGDDMTLGLYVSARHLNIQGRLHGGAIMTLGDIVIVRNLSTRLGLKGLPTVAINFSFMRPGIEGQWVEAALKQLEIKRTMAFAQGELTSKGHVIVTFNATFKLPTETAQ